MNLSMQNRQRINKLLFILWAGGTALLSYSLVYMMRKPFTAGVYEGFELWGMDYKVAVTTIQIIGYLIAKLVGIKLISELKKEHRFKFFAVSVVLAQISLIGFGLIPAPYNALVMLLNGMSLGCMWGVIFSFIEGRRVTDVLASMLSVSIVFSSGLAKSVGLFLVNDLGVDQFWMPAVVGGVALPLLFVTAYSLIKLPAPSQCDKELRCERESIDRQGRRAIFRKYMLVISIILAANFLIVILRDIKEDFLVNIIDMEGQSSWLFAKVDTVVTLVILCLFALSSYIKKNLTLLVSLLALVVVSSLTMAYISLNHQALQLSTMTWLFMQSLPLYIGYLAFQSVFFDRFIACFRVKGNVGYFIALIDFVGYLGTVLALIIKEMLSIDTHWFELYNLMGAVVGLVSAVSFSVVIVLIIKTYRRENPASKAVAEPEDGVVAAA